MSGTGFDEFVFVLFDFLVLFLMREFGRLCFLLCFSDAFLCCVCCAFLMLKLNKNKRCGAFYQRLGARPRNKVRLDFLVLFCVSLLCFSGAMFDEFVLYVCAYLALFLVREFVFLLVLSDVQTQSTWSDF